MRTVMQFAYKMINRYHAFTFTQTTTHYHFCAEIKKKEQHLLAALNFIPN